MIGRWHDLVRGKGVLIFEAEDPVAVSNWTLNWNSLMDFEIGIVHDDSGTQEIGRPRLARASFDRFWAWLSHQASAGAGGFLPNKKPPPRRGF